MNENQLKVPDYKSGDLLRMLDDVEIVGDFWKEIIKEDNNSLKGREILIINVSTTDQMYGVAILDRQSPNDDGMPNLYQNGYGKDNLYWFPFYEIDEANVHLDENSGILEYYLKKSYEELKEEMENSETEDSKESEQSA